MVPTDVVAQGDCGAAGPRRAAGQTRGGQGSRRRPVDDEAGIAHHDLFMDGVGVFFRSQLSVTAMAETGSPPVRSPCRQECASMSPRWDCPQAPGRNPGRVFRP